MPEARIPLAECTIYLASSAKSNSAYMAINQAMEVAAQTQTSSVPLYLRNAPTKLMEQLGYSDGYKYAHDYPGHFADMEFMPEDLAGTKFYEPGDNRQEENLRSRLEGLWPKYYQKG
jgi:putative ATPase